MDQQLQNLYIPLVTAAAQAGTLPSGQGQVAQTQLIGVANDVLALREALENEGPAAFFSDPDWNQMLLVDVGLVQVYFQLTAGAVAVPFPAMNDLGQTMSQGNLDALQREDLTDQMNAQGCAPDQASPDSSGSSSDG